MPLFILATEDIGFKRRAEDVVISNIAKMLHVNKDYIDNPQGMIDILIGLESANLLLREVHYVAGILVQKSIFSKDMLGNSVLTNIGGMKFEEANSIYNPDSHPANLLRNCEAQNSTFHLKNVPSIDIELMPRSANVSKTLAASITNPLSCSSILDKLTRRRDDDYDPGSGPGAGHYMPAPPIQSVNVATAVQSNQVNTQNSANGYTKKLKMSLKLQS